MSTTHPEGAVMTVTISGPHGPHKTADFKATQEGTGGVVLHSARCACGWRTVLWECGDSVRADMASHAAAFGQPEPPSGRTA